eukprot:Awhi_evm1s10814
MVTLETLRIEHFLNPVSQLLIPPQYIKVFTDFLLYDNQAELYRLWNSILEYQQSFNQINNNNNNNNNAEKDVSVVVEKKSSYPDSLDYDEKNEPVLRKSNNRLTLQPTKSSPKSKALFILQTFVHRNSSQSVSMPENVRENIVMYINNDIFDGDLFVGLKQSTLERFTKFIFPRFLTFISTRHILLRKLQINSSSSQDSKVTDENLITMIKEKKRISTNYNTMRSSISLTILDTPTEEEIVSDFSNFNNESKVNFAALTPIDSEDTDTDEEDSILNNQIESVKKESIEKILSKESVYNPLFTRFLLSNKELANGYMLLLACNHFQSLTNEKEIEKEKQIMNDTFLVENARKKVCIPDNIKKSVLINDIRDDSDSSSNENFSDTEVDFQDNNDSNCNNNSSYNNNNRNSSNSNINSNSNSNNSNTNENANNSYNINNNNSNSENNSNSNLTLTNRSLTNINDKERIKGKVKVKSKGKIKDKNNMNSSTHTKKKYNKKKEKEKEIDDKEKTTPNFYKAVEEEIKSKLERDGLPQFYKLLKTDLSFQSQLSDLFLLAPDSNALSTKSLSSSSSHSLTQTNSTSATKSNRSSKTSLSGFSLSHPTLGPNTGSTTSKSLSHSSTCFLTSCESDANNPESVVSLSYDPNAPSTHVSNLYSSSVCSLTGNDDESDNPNPNFSSLIYNNSQDFKKTMPTRSKSLKTIQFNRPSKYSSLSAFSSLQRQHSLKVITLEDDSSSAVKTNDESSSSNNSSNGTSRINRDRDRTLPSFPLPDPFSASNSDGKQLSFTSFSYTNSCEESNPANKFNTFTAMKDKNKERLEQMRLSSLIDDQEIADLTLKQLLSSKQPSSAYKYQRLYTTYLVSEHSEENYMFWHMIENYKAQNSQFKIDQQAALIVSTFILANSPKAVNIKETTRELILSQASSQQLNNDSFAEAQCEVFNLMKRDSFKRFKISIQEGGSLRQRLIEELDRHKRVHTNRPAMSRSTSVGEAMACSAADVSFFLLLLLYLLCQLLSVYTKNCSLIFTTAT